MLSAKDMKHFPIAEQLVDVLTTKTQNNSPMFFRIMVAYYFTKVASMMRTNIDTPDRGLIPVNMYAINLAKSGFGKGFSTSIVEEQVINEFRDRFLAETFPMITEQNLAKVAVSKAQKNPDSDPDAELDRIQREFDALGELAFSFDSATTPAVKQMRYKLLLSSAGSVNFECYTGDVEVLTDRGFVRFDQLHYADLIAQFDPKDESIELVARNRTIAKKYKGKIYDFVSDSKVSMSVTANHDVLVAKDGKYSKLKPNEITTRHKFRLTGKLKSVGRPLDDLTKLSIILHLAAFEKGDALEIRVTPSKNLDEVLQLLKSLDIPYTQTKLGSTTILLIYREYIPTYNQLKRINLIGLPLISVGKSYCLDFLKTIEDWRFTVRNRPTPTFTYYSDLEESREYVYALAVLAGYTCQYNASNDDSWNTLTINKNPDNFASLRQINPGINNRPGIRSVREFNGTVYCVSVPSGNIVIRRNGKTMMGGNCDEIGSNLLANQEVLTSFLELYDLGKIKQKLTKNTAENSRGADLVGRTPTNMMLYGTPFKLLDGGKTEEEFYSLLGSGYARRCFFGFAKANKKTGKATPEEIYARLTDSTKNKFLEQLSTTLARLASPVNFNKNLPISKDVSLKLIEYRMQCEELAEKLGEHDEIRKAELEHRYFKALKLAGTYAFIDEAIEVEESHLFSAIKLAEESGEAFQKLLKRDPPYVKLAKYIADVEDTLTVADLVENLPFFKGTATQKKEMIELAIAYGYSRNIIIKKTYSQGVELLKGEALKETNLDEVILSYSTHLAQGYKADKPKFSELYKLTQQPGFKWLNHHVKGGHRLDDNIIPGFNLIVLDVDDNISLESAKLLLKDYTAHYYTTKSHTESHNRFRIILPASHIVKLSSKDYSKFMDNLYRWLPFEVDTSTKDRPRMWSSNPGEYSYNYGELLDVTDFIPDTTRNTDLNKRMLTHESMTNLERWFAMRMEEGNRNSTLIKYALCLVDAGKPLHKIQDAIFNLNSKLDAPLTELEIINTIMKSATRAFSNKLQNQKD